MDSTDAYAQGAKYFGQISPRDLKNLEHNAQRASSAQMAEAAALLQTAFHGQKCAWFGGWALRLRGYQRETSDLDLLVLANDVSQVRARLAPFNWYVLSLQAELAAYNRLLGLSYHTIH